MHAFRLPVFGLPGPSKIPGTFEIPGPFKINVLFAAGIFEGSGISAPRPGQRCHPHRCRTGVHERAGNGASSGASGENVIDHQDISPCNSCRISDNKSTPHIQPALAGRKACLALRGALANERVVGQSKPPRGMAAGKRLQGVAGECAGLVESAFRVPGAMKRNRNHQHFSRRVGCELADCTRQTIAEFACRRLQPVIFERVNGCLHAAFVQAECDRADKRRRGEATNAAQRFRAGAKRKLVKHVAAAGARRASEDGKLSPADFANWNAGDLRQGRAAEGAGTGKEGATEDVDGTSEHANHCAPAGCLRWRNLKRE